MMCVLEGTSITMPDTPQSTARFTSSTMQRENAKICGPRLRLTISLIAAVSLGDTTGMPASMRCTPASASAFGDADLVVLGEDDAGLLLAVAQRDVVKLRSASGNEAARARRRLKFHGLTNHLSVFQGSCDMMTSSN